MMQRVSTLTRYLLGRQSRSVAGGIGVLSAAILWWIFFNPRGGSAPEMSMLTLIVGMYGFGLSFLMTLSTAAKVYRGDSAPLFVRLPSRIEFLTATMLCVATFTLFLQLILALVVFIQPGGVDFVFNQAIQIPPLWIALNLFAAVFAFHATDLVQSGWSRVWIFGVAAVLLFSQSADARTMGWLSKLLGNWATSAGQRGWTQIGTSLRQASNWAFESGLDFTEALGVVFWPFRAISKGALAGSFNSSQALAPAILLLYATILFLLAADFLAHKDLHLLD